MDSFEDDLFVVEDSDSIILQHLVAAREANPPSSRRRTTLHLPHPPSQPPPSRPSRTRRPNERSMQTQTDPSVIDLTAEPDSPVRERRTAASSSRASRNPRRTNSQRISPPQLARSDSTLFTPSTGVIDLTVDSPEESRPSDSTRARASRSHHYHAHNPHRPPNHAMHNSRGPGNPDELVGLQFLSNEPGQEFPAFTIGLSRRFAGIFSNNINMLNLPPHLDITRTAFMARAPSPKPAMEPAPPTRDGFTRDTCADPEKASENVVICPACEEELAYDPTDTTPSTHSTPSKKRKRAAGEHHFWALKKCGHVYCADCFENRRPTKANPRGVGFRTLDGKTPASAINDLRCVVDGCETKVTSKSEWVGIFL